MRLPYKVKDFKSVQRNFDYLQARVMEVIGGTYRSTPIKTQTVSMPVGLAGVALDMTGLPSGVVVKGFIVIHIQTTVHWTFNWFPNNSGVIVFQNAGAAQSATISYMVIG